MKNPGKDLYRSSSARNEKFPDVVNLEVRVRETPDFFASDLYGDDVTMMAEVYGSDFQKVWKKTRKKWWI